MSWSIAGKARAGAGVVLVLALTLVLFGASGASADVQHGIGFQKGCDSPTKVGDPVFCRYAVANNNFTNESLDTVTFDYVADVTHAAGGDTPETNILGSLELYVTFGTPTCVATGGTGTFADPWTGVTSCTLPGGNILLGNGSSIESKNHAGYVVQPADFNLPNHQLNDDAKLHWKDTCDVAPNNCNTNQQTQTAPSATVVVRRASQTTTDIHNAQHQVVTTVAVGTTVHDRITVTTADPDPNNPIPHGGNVFLEWFENGTCTGNPAASATVGPVDATGHFDATGFPQTPNVAGHYAFRGHYLGDGTYDASDGPCEPLTVVDANIQITPDGVNRVGQSHTFTAHVNVNDGNGFANAADGTLISFTIDSGPGAFTTANPCTTAGGTGSCTMTLSSAVTGLTTVSAHTTVTVGGVQLTRNTDNTGANSRPATKLWVNAKISIAASATNEVGKPHTFTVTLQKDTGGGFGAAAGEHVTVTLTDANGATHTAPTGTCTNAGANTDANGQCTITFTSNAAGTVTAHASSTLSVAGSAAFTVQTDGQAPNSGDAIKAFVDANIQISPLTANNPVSTNHTLTGHVNVNLGNGAGFVNAPAGTTISFAITNSGGASAAFVGPSSCTTAGATGSCTVVISSSTTGTTTVKATTTVTVGGVALTRSTGDGKLGDSADANKTWADDTVRTDIHNAAHTVILTAAAGTIVHDNVQVAKAAGTTASVPNPTGSVIFHRYATINCSGTAVNQTVALTPGSPSTAESDTFAPTADMSYQAEYLGDANYPAHTGACEPLTVTPAPSPAIAIVKNPKAQVVAVNGTARFTITVTNTGNVILRDVHVVDPLSPNCNRTKADIPALASMAPGAAVTYSCTRPNMKCTGPGAPYKSCALFTNVATAIGTPPSGPDVTATDTAPVKVSPLQPKKPVKPKVVSHKKPKATG